MEKFFNKLGIFTLLICFIFLASGFIFWEETKLNELENIVVAESAKIDTNKNIIKEQFGEAYAANYAQSADIADSVMSVYRAKAAGKNDSKDGFIYNENFAGVWYDSNGKLNIGVTKEANVEKRRNSSVVYHDRRFSFNYLNEIHDTITEIASKYSIHSAAVLLQDNQVEVNISDEKYITDIIKYLSASSLFEEEAIKFIVSDNNITSKASSLHSGNKVSVGTVFDSWYGTLSAKAICNKTGQKGVLTNEHVAPLGRHVRYDNFFGATIGATERAQYGGRIDAAFVPFDNASSWEFSSSATFNNTIIQTTYVAKRSSIIAGLPVVKFGATTGLTIGKISSVNASHSNGTFTNYIRHTAFIDNGDSGSPLFTVDSNGRYIMLGINSHANDKDDYDFGYACNIQNVMEDLDVTIEAISTGIGPNEWLQPTWTSNTTTSDGQNHGTITASGSTTDRQPYGAFDGWIGDVNKYYPAAQWTQTNAKSGWIQLKLNSAIIVHSIEFYNRYSDTSNRTKGAYFTGAGGVALGAPFTGVNENAGRSVVFVGGIATDVIRLNITSTWSGLLATDMIGANEIIIHATTNISQLQPPSAGEALLDPIPVANVIASSGANPQNALKNDATTWKSAQGDVNGCLDITFEYDICIEKITFYGLNNIHAVTIYANNVPVISISTPTADFNVNMEKTVTSEILIMFHSNSAYVGVRYIQINATYFGWKQPFWGDPTNSDGTVIASSGANPHNALNNNAVSWTSAQGDVNGCIHITLNYDIRIFSITLYVLNNVYAVTVFANNVSVMSTSTPTADFIVNMMSTVTNDILIMFHSKSAYVGVTYIQINAGI